MYERITGLTEMVPSLSVWNVWDLPLWAWRSYARRYDDHVAELRKIREREQQQGGGR